MLHRKPSGESPKVAAGRWIAFLLFLVMWASAPASSQTLTIEFGQGVFDDPRVREAVRLAVDWRPLAQRAGLRVDDIVVQYGRHREALGEESSNLDRAKALMAEAGYAGAERIAVFVFHGEGMTEFAQSVSQVLGNLEMTSAVRFVAPDMRDSAIRSTRFVTGRSTVELPFLFLSLERRAPVPPPDREFEERPTAPAQPERPDLVVEELEVRHDRDGQRLLAIANVRNVGNAPSGPHEVEFYDESGAIGFMLGRAAIGPLAPGGRATARASTIVPDRVMGRTVSIRATVDSENAVLESNERNNLSDLASALLERPEPPRLPDLVAKQLVVRYVPDAQELAIVVTIANRGQEVASPHQVYIEELNNLLGVPLIGMPTIEPGGQRDRALRVPIPDRLLGRTLHLRAEADSEGVVREASEANFGEVVSAKIPRPEPPRLPDLSLSQLELSARPMASSVHLTLSVINGGVTLSPPTLLEIRTGHGALFERITVPRLDPGQSWPAKRSFRPDTGFFGGTVRVIAFVDATDRTHESDETNNRGVASLWVWPPVLPWAALAGLGVIVLWGLVRSFRRQGRRPISRAARRPDAEPEVLPKDVSLQPRPDRGVQILEDETGQPLVTVEFSLRPIIDSGIPVTRFEETD